MARRLVRCIEGHVFDADAQEACPVCGAPAHRGRVMNEGASDGDMPEQSSSSNRRHGPAAPRPAPIPPRLGLAGTALILVGLGAYWFLPRPPGPAVGPDRHDEQKQATPEKEKTDTPPDRAPSEENPRPTASQPTPVIEPGASKRPPEGKAAQKEGEPKKPGLHIHINPDALMKPCQPNALSDEYCSRSGQTPPDAPTAKLDSGDQKIIAAEEKLLLGDLARELLAVTRARRALGRDEDQIARSWLSSEILRDNPMAKYIFGRLLLLGKQGEHNVEAGLNHLESAAYANSFQAALLLGQLYNKGNPSLGVPVNKEKAGFWFQRALIDAPDKLTQDLLKEGYVLTPPAPTLVDMASAKQRRNFAKAFEIAKNLAGRGSVIAEYWYGYSILKGLGTNKNIPSAIVLITRCARNLEPNAIGLLGELASSGNLPGADFQTDALTFKLMARTFDHEDGVGGNDWDAGIQQILKSLDQEHYDTLVAAVGDILEVPAR
jgi:TPR repeat protein